MQISNIDISLSLGQLIWKWKALVVFMIIPFIFPLLTIIMLFFPIVWDAQMLFALGGMNIISILILSLPIYIIIKDRKNKKKIKLWLDDAIETKAYSKKMGEAGVVFLPKGIMIQVRFKINKKKYTKYSTVKVVGEERGYIGAFKKYADREIRIMYSPKYDEVLILKDKK